MACSCVWSLIVTHDRRAVEKFLKIQHTVSVDVSLVEGLGHISDLVAEGHPVVCLVQRRYLAVLNELVIVLVVFGEQLEDRFNRNLFVVQSRQHHGGRCEQQ